VVGVDVEIEFVVGVELCVGVGVVDDGVDVFALILIVITFESVFFFSFDFRTVKVV
jgi:hypothetical protein